jgi:hypothetical protein
MGAPARPKGDLGGKILRTLETKNVQALFAGDIGPKKVPMKCHMRPLSGNMPLVRPPRRRISSCSLQGVCLSRESLFGCNSLLGSVAYERPGRMD